MKPMKTMMLIFGVLTTVFFGAANTSVSAQGIDFRVGPRGAHVDIGRHHRNWRHRYWRHHHVRCRVIIRHRINRRGDRVTVRRRICN